MKHRHSIIFRFAACMLVVPLLLLLLPLAVLARFTGGVQRLLIQNIFEGDELRRNRKYVERDTPRRWRSAVKKAIGELECQRFTLLCAYHNEAWTYSGRPNQHLVFRSPDGRSTFSWSWLVWNRHLPVIPLQIPFPEWTGELTVRRAVQTKLADGRLIVTTAFETKNSEWPECFFIETTQENLPSEELICRHAAQLERALAAQASAIVPIETKEEYFAEQDEQNKMFAAIAQKSHRRMLQELAQGL